MVKDKETKDLLIYNLRAGDVLKDKNTNEICIIFNNKVEKTKYYIVLVRNEDLEKAYKLLKNEYISIHDIIMNTELITSTDYPYATNQWYTKKYITEDYEYICNILIQKEEVYKSGIDLYEYINKS